MKKIYTLLLLLSITPIVLKAQSNFKPGYVVDLKGDTVKGWVDYREWDNNPTTITFKNTSGFEGSYTIETAKAFGVNGYEYFERYTLPISQGATNSNNITTISADTAIVKMVFLHLLDRGKIISLYSYTDVIKKRFYLIEGNNMNPQELVYKLYANTDDGSTAKKITRYKTQLQYIVQKNSVNNATLVRHINNADYNETELLKISHELNDNTSANRFGDQGTSGSKFFIGVGANYSLLQFAGDTPPFPAGTKATSILPSINAGVDLFFNKSTRRAYFRSEISLNANNFNFPPTVTIATSTSTPGSASLLLKQFNISIAPMFGYNIYNNDNLKIFFQGGMLFNFSSYNDYHYHIDYRSNFPSLDSKVPEFETFWISFPLRAGIDINNKLEVKFGYNTISSIATYNNYSSNLTTYSVGINFLFGK